MGLANFVDDFARAPAVKMADGDVLTLVVSTDAEPVKKETQFKGRDRVQWLLDCDQFMPADQQKTAGRDAGSGWAPRTWFMGYETTKTLHAALRAVGPELADAGGVQLCVKREGSGMDDTRYHVTVEKLIPRAGDAGPLDA